MKKLALLTLAILSWTTVGAADFGRTLESPDFNSGKTIWIVRAGIGLNGTAGGAKDAQIEAWKDNNRDGSFKTTPGFDVSFGFNKSFGEHPLYWGMELTLGTRGYKTSAVFERSASSSVSGGSDYHKKVVDEKLSTYNVQLSPITIGYKYTFLERMAADIHVGAYAAYDFAGNYTVLTEDIIHSTGKYGSQNKHTSDKEKVKIGDIDGMHKFDAGMNLGIGYWFGHLNVDLTWQRGFVPIYKGGDDHLYTNNIQIRLGYAF